MKPRSTEVNNIIRRFRRRHKRLIKKSVLLQQLYENEEVRNHSDLLERTLLQFQGEGALSMLHEIRMILDEDATRKNNFDN